ncbi:SwmB domain-containing protein [Cohnella lubricantis]|uniref:Ig-like domain-containing protein n=1 Tax=Cohnella lubricantis TaxID=2163172 RepID=A0A841TBE6_9BACL|nr:SwmB domain-containing protein [Cohnella lubricantis]MBB6678793.1 Ig-like domain-containing protein [Cohnella lubricantis]MBP2117876.1 putative repeat protein (TIGR02059 family) [Cohnella lubricantis]
MQLSRIRSIAVFVAAALFVQMIVPLGGWGDSSTAYASGTYGPIVRQLVPPSGELLAPSSTNLTLTFDENIIRGAGYITVQRENAGAWATVGAPIDVMDVNRVLLEQPTRIATIALDAPLTDGNYNVIVDAGAFASQSTGRPYAGTSTWQFTVAPDAALAPVYNPTPGYAEVSADAAIALTIDYQKPMKKGSGNIYVKRQSDNATVQTIAVTSGSVSIRDKTVTIRLAKLDSATNYYILMDMGALLDLGNNPYGITDPTVWPFKTKAAMDRTPPTVEYFTPTSGGIMGELNGYLKIKFSEKMYAGSGSVTIKQGNAAFCTIAAESGAVDGYDTDTLTIKPSVGHCAAFANNTTYTVVIDSLAFHDAAGNNYAGSSNWSIRVIQDVQPPEVVSLSPSAGVKSVAVDANLFAIKFNKAVTIGNASGAWIKQLSAPTAPTIPLRLAVSPSDSTTVNLTPADPATRFAAGAGYAIYIDRNAITSLGGYGFPGILNDYYWGFQTIGSDTTKPQFNSATMDGLSVLLNYSEELDESSVPDAGNFYVTVGDVPVQALAVTVSGKQVAVKLQNSVPVGQRVTIAYTAGTHPIRDLSLNEAANLSSRDVANSAAGTLPAPLAGTINGSVLTLQFNKVLDSLASNAASQFAVQYNGSPVIIRTLALNGSTLTFVLNTMPTTGQPVTISYQPDGAPLRDISGNAVAAFTNFSVTNGIDLTPPALNGGSVSGSVVSLVFNEGLDSGSTPGRTNFLVRVNGTVIAVNSVSIDGNTVKLTMPQAIGSGSVQVSYMPGTSVLKDMAGNPAAAFNNYQVSQGEASAVIYSSGTVDDSIVTLLFSGSLDGTSEPSASQFRVAAGGVTLTVGAVDVSGPAVKLALLTAPPAGETVAVTYTSSGTSLLDSAGKAVASFGPVSIASSANGLPNYVKANGEGGLLFDIEHATAATDTLSSGTGANRYTLDGDLVATAFSVLKTNNAFTQTMLNVVVPESEPGAMVAIPIRGILNANTRAPSGVIRVDYGVYQMEYPLLAINSSTLSQILSTDPSAYLLLQIEKASDPKLNSMLSLQGGRLLAPSADFTAFTVANGVKKEVEAFDNEVISSIKVPGGANFEDAQLSVVRFDDEINDLLYTPTTLTRSGNAVIMSSSRKGNGLYAAVSNSRVYSDVSQIEWAKDSVNTLASKFIIDRASGNYFKPNANITRGDFAKYIVRALGLEGSRSSAARYNDVNASGSDAAYIGAASAAGIVQGGTDGRFRPEASITREEMALMMQRAMTYAGKSVSYAGSELNAFKDKNSVSSYAKEAVLQNIAAGIMNGMSATAFQPQDNATRAQAIVMLDRMLNYIGYIQS